MKETKKPILTSSNPLLSEAEGKQPRLVPHSHPLNDYTID